MEAIAPSEVQQTEEEIAAAANSKPQTDTEKKAQELFKALEEAEFSFAPGIEFGFTMIALREERKASGDKNWMLRLEELGISYAKARYWMTVAEGKPIHRGKPKVSEKRSLKQMLAKLGEAIDEIDRESRGNEQVRDDAELKKQVGNLMEILGGDNEEDLLQRKQCPRCGLVKRVDEEKSDSTGSSR